MKNLTTFDEFLNESTPVNEAADYGTTEWARKDNKEIFQYREKIIDLAEEAIEWLKEEALLSVAKDPDTFDLDNIGFAFSGNAAFVLVAFSNPKLRNRYSAPAHEDEIERLPGFKKYFDITAMTSSAGSIGKNYDMCFRLKI